jgi:hypothetical protein
MLLFYYLTLFSEEKLRLSVPFALLFVQIEELAIMVQKVGLPWWMSIKSLHVPYAADSANYP